MIFASDSFFVGQDFPLSTTVFPDIITIVLARIGRPSDLQIERLQGAQKQIMRELSDYKQGKYANLVSGSNLARKAWKSEASFET